jgi:hypothetical protein
VAALARTAEAEAIRLDERDASQRERARPKKEADAHALQQKGATREQGGLHSVNAIAVERIWR